MKAEEKSQQDTVRISVRSLVEFLLRSGDIDQTAGALADPDTMQMGSRLHRKLLPSDPLPIRRCWIMP